MGQFIIKRNRKRSRYHVASCCQTSCALKPEDTTAERFSQGFSPRWREAHWLSGLTCGNAARMIRDGLVLLVDDGLTSLLQGEEMSPLFMDTEDKPSSPGSLSAEESQGNTPGSGREEEGEQTGQRGTKRQEKNRDAARKSRKKQTERADELHEELQGLEQSNSALRKEIASLRRDLHLYTTALESHNLFCCLKDTASSSSSTSCVSVSASADCQAGSSAPGVPPPASTYTQPAAAPSLSVPLTPTLGLQTLGYVERTHLSSSPPAPATKALASPTGSSSEVFTPSGSTAVPHSVSFSAIPLCHSLFSDDPPLITSRQINVMPICTSSLTTAAKPQSRQGAIHDRSSMSANAGFSTLHPDALDGFPMDQASFLTASSNVMPPYSHLVAENTGLVAQGCPTNVPQLHPGNFRGNPIMSSPLSSLLLSTLQDPALQSFSVSPQLNPEQSPASVFAPKPSYSQRKAPNAASLLSQLTVPSPLNIPQTTSSSFDGPLPQPPSPLPPSGDTSGDVFLSEFLEINDWILQ